MAEVDGFGIRDKVAIVTGGGAAGDGIGNGRAAAILMAREGARVLVVDCKLDRAEQTVTMIREEGGEAAAVRADVTVAKDCESMVQAALSHWGRIDILDNNVGIGSRKSVVEEDPAEWDRVMQTNVSTMFLASKYTIPAMAETAGGGVVINVSSISALRPRGLTAYSASKGAVIALSRAMAIDHAPDGVRVNCVVPGPVYTPMVYASGMSEQARANRAKASPLGIEGTGWDVGNAVLFLASERARYITGQTLVVDGGITIVGPARESD